MYRFPPVIGSHRLEQLLDDDDRLDEELLELELELELVSSLPKAKMTKHRRVMTENIRGVIVTPINS